MSVICQNFVQNAWKKDLCSNCFKSLDDHNSSIISDCSVARTTWKSLITERDRNGNCTKPFRLENGFHGKLLTIVPALTGNDIIPDRKLSFQSVNGHSENVIGILRTSGSDKKQLQTSTKTNVGFKEEEPLVIGYGGNDYDIDEPEWELSQLDDREPPLDSLDETEEDRAISKITRENTEFNAKNANLLIANNQISKEEEHNAKNSRKVEPLPKASVKPFFRQTTWSESVVSNAVNGKQTNPIDNEVVSITAAEIETETAASLSITEEREKEDEEIPSPQISKTEDESTQSNLNQQESTPKNLTARTSFLHGGATEEIATPIALYTPGDDLFVRSNSSSSEETVPSDFNSDDSSTDVMDQSSVDTTKTAVTNKPEVPSKPTTVYPANVKVSEELDDSVLYDDGRTIYYAVSSALHDGEHVRESPEQPRRTPVPLINHYAECRIYQDIEPNRTPSPPDSSRRSKLAALAVELEQARHSGGGGGTPIKRQAPSPPDTSGCSTPVQNFSRNSLPTSACSTPAVSSTPIVNPEVYTKPKSSSLGSGSSRSKILMCIGGGTDDTYYKSRKKFSLKKLLKRGSKDVEDYPPIDVGTPNPKAWKQNDFSKIKLEIIHPMDMINDRKSPDLDGGSVKESPGENVNQNSLTGESGYDNIVSPSQHESHESVVVPSRSSSGCQRALTRPPRPPKPPPPPRCHSMIPENKGQKRPDSPKSNSIAKCTELKTENENDPKPQVPKRQYKVNGKSDYANLGDVRTSVAPKKPERTQAIEGQEAIKRCDIYEPLDEQTYHDVMVPPSTKTSQDTSITYSTKKEVCEVQKPTSSPPAPPPPPYGRIGCNSATEEKPWISLEASYNLLSAVNLDVLARLLDNAVHDRCYQLERPDKEGLQWTDFDLEMDQPVQILADKIIYDATFRHGNRTTVTLLVNPWGLHSSLSGSRNYTRYPILAHFMDHVPRNFVFPEVGNTTNSEGVLTSVYVLHRARLSSLRSLVDEPEYEREVFFVMLQLIHSLKTLQASGIEDIEPEGHNIFFARTEKDRLHNLVFLSPDLPFERVGDLFLSNTDSSRVSLCRYALSTMLLLMGVEKARNVKSTKETFKKSVLVINDVLLKEKSHSLSQAKSILDYVLWNAEEAVSVSDKMSVKTDSVLQRWLDVERARKLKNLAAGSVITNLTAYEEHHLTFLVRNNARTLREIASML